MSVADVIEGREMWTLEEGDCLDVLRSMPDRCVDAVVTDPPAGIAFMNAEWDKDKGGRDEWIAWLSTIFTELRRVVKPGGHALVWALPRTSHWTATAVENAGWTIRDVGVHLFGSGFPKSVDLSKAVDKRAGAPRQPDVYTGANGKNAVYGNGMGGGQTLARAPAVTAAAAAAALQGWGSALKPAAENWILARAPLAEKTLVANVLAHGTGGLNIDAGRIGYASQGDQAAAAAAQRLCRDQNDNRVALGQFNNGAASLQPYLDKQALGRWPANVTLQHMDGCMVVGTRETRRGILGTVAPDGSAHAFADGGLTGRRAEVAEVAEVYACVDGCPVKLLDEQSGDRPGMSGGGAHAADYGGGMFGGIDSTATARCDFGGASRFFYTAKPASSEKEKGLDWMPERIVNDGREADGAGNDNPRLRGATKRRNVHPTVKPVALMRWLCKLITPPGGVVLDCFAGSGTTLVAALADGFRVIGIEQNAEFARIAAARVNGDMPLLNRVGGSRG